MRTSKNKKPEFVWYIKLDENYYIGPYMNKPGTGRYMYPDYPRIKFKIVEEII